LGIPLHFLSVHPLHPLSSLLEPFCQRRLFILGSMLCIPPPPQSFFF
jgi:hypothetical protein